MCHRFFPCQTDWSVKKRLSSMNRFLIVFVLFAVATLARADEYDEPIQGGRSPDQQIEVVNIHNGEGGYFVIRNSSG
jgi:hypothetical protein